MIDYEKLLQKVTKTLFVGKFKYDIEFTNGNKLRYFASGAENREDVDLTEEEYDYLKQYTVEGNW